MPVNPRHTNPDAPRPERGDHNFDQGAGDEGGHGAPESAARKAHGTHGRGDSREERPGDEQAVDSGDDPQFRRGGAGRDEAPDPAKFAKQSEGRMGGAGTGSEGVGGSVVDRRAKDSHA